MMILDRNDMVELVKELAEPSRRAILSELRTGPKSVSDIVEATGLKQPNVSNHLARLRDKGILKASKVGRQVFYSFVSPDMSQAVSGLLRPAEPTILHPEALGEELTRIFSRKAVAGDEQGCTEIVDSLLHSGANLVPIYSRLFAPSLGMIGQWWLVKAVDEGQEHLASAIIERLMSRVINFAALNSNSVRRVVLGCSPGNWHSVGIRMISDVMKLEGWKTYYLGANVPTAAFVSAVVEHAPEVVMISCSLDDHLPDCLETVGKINEVRSGKVSFSIGVGGRALLENFEAAAALGADFSARDLTHFTEEVLPMLIERKTVGV